MFKKLGKNKLFLALALVVVVVVAVVVYRMTRKENFFNSGLKCGDGTIEDEDESMCVPNYDKLCRYGTKNLNILTIVLQIIKKYRNVETELEKKANNVFQIMIILYVQKKIFLP